MGRKKKFIQKPYTDNKVYKKSKVPFHINYTMRLSFVFISVIFVGLVLGSFTNQINTLYRESKFDIRENGYINYEVHLKENGFYNDSVLGMDMAYVPELINNINLKFNYNFYSEEYVDVRYDDTIKYDFIILDNKTNAVLYNVVTSEAKSHRLLKDNKIKFDDEVVIDYAKYKQKFDEFVNLYGSDISAYLNVSNTIDKSSEMDVLEGYFDVDKAYSIKIPVTNKIFSINTTEDSKLKNDIEVYSESKLNKANTLLIITTILLCALFVGVFLIFIKLISLLSNKQSKYDKYVSGLLREYDSIVVETMVYPKEEGLNKIKVNSFKEIIDAHDLVHKPIMYYNVVSHMKCMFYLLDDKDLYVYTVKEVDLEK